VESAHEHFVTACRMDPANMEYRQAVNRMDQQRNTGGYRAPAPAAGGCTACDVCQGMIFAELLLRMYGRRPDPLLLTVVFRPGRFGAAGRFFSVVAGGFYGKGGKRIMKQSGRIAVGGVFSALALACMLMTISLTRPMRCRRWPASA